MKLKKTELLTDSLKILFGLLLVSPMILAACISFMPKADIIKIPFKIDLSNATLENYIYAFENMNILTYFTTNGVGVLSDVIDCTVIQTLNGQYELEMTYPIKGIHFLEIQQRSIITAKPDPVSDPQPFRVYRITKPLNRVVTIYARHVAYDLMGVTVSPFSASGVAAALQALKGNAVGECPFTFWTDKSTSATMSVKVPTAIWTLLGGSVGSVLDCFGGEYEFDRWTVRLHNRRGADRGVSIRYGKNLTSLEQDENCANCYTGVYPYWTNADGAYVELPEKIVNASGNYGYAKTLPLDLSQEWQEAPTADQLRSRAQKYVSDNDIGTPAVSWKVEFVELEKTEEYKGMALLEQVLLGDTVSVSFSEMGVSASARAVETRYKPVLERYENVSLGSVKANLADTIAAQQRQINSKPNQTQMQMAINALTAAILGASGGAVRLLDNNGDGMPDTLYIADDPDPSKAVKVWRFNYEGWGASSTGYNGPYTMGATFEKGFLADFITAGTLKSADGRITIDLSGGAAKFLAGIITNGITVRDDFGMEKDLFQVYTTENGAGVYYLAVELKSCVSDNTIMRLCETWDMWSNPTGVYLDMVGDAGSISLRTDGEAVSVQLNRQDFVSVSADGTVKLWGKTPQWGYNSTVGGYILMGT